MLVDVWNFAVSEIGLAEGRIWFSAFRHFWYNNSGAVRGSWSDTRAGNECRDMVHGRECSFWSVPVLERHHWRLGEAFWLVGAHFANSGITCNVSLLSVSSSRI